MLGPFHAPPSKPGKSALATRLSVFVWTGENYSNALLVDVSVSVFTKYRLSLDTCGRDLTFSLFFLLDASQSSFYHYNQILVLFIYLFNHLFTFFFMSQ